jgi:hypothetical protein
LGCRVAQALMEQGADRFLEQFRRP